MSGERAEELTIDDLDQAAGGMSLFQDHDDEANYTYRDLYNPPKYRCPKCGSRNVLNYDPGEVWQMRVKCNDCGYFGCRGDADTTRM